jgi:2-polyprenyl-3-methyl-5-hydroxy-6-metoxy-1,4-benzoquinol methylase
MNNLQMDKIVSDFWYYSVELPDGRFTPGFKFPNVALTRNLLRAAKIEGNRCFDFGTMEGLVPTLLAKRGARQVVAVDNCDFSDKIQLVKSLHGVQFQYNGNVSLDQTVAFARSISDRFDIVVVSGILYHVFSPFHLLGYARSLTRLGGLVIIETAAILDQNYAMYYNFLGDRYIYTKWDTWFMSVPLLDYLLRFCRLAPLDCIFFQQGHAQSLVRKLFSRKSPAHDVIRIGIACRATEKFLADSRETLMVQSADNTDYNVIVEDDPPSPRLENVPYTVNRPKLIFRQTTGTCDLLASCMAMPDYKPTPDECVLRLAAEV